MSYSDKILTFAEYSTLRHESPYLVSLKRGQRRLLLFGVRHSSEPSDPMFDQIERAFAAVSPQFAMHEGTRPAIEPLREIAIRRHGEAGLIRHLAAKAGIETDSMDIPLPDEAERLRSEYSQREALVFLVVRQLASFNRKTARMDFDAYFEEFFELIAPPLGFETLDWRSIRKAHLEVLGRPLVAPDVDGEETDPTRDATLTQRIASRSNRLRDIHMLERLLEAWRTYDRVLATIGVTHAVMLEPALRAAAAAR